MQNSETHSQLGSLFPTNLDRRAHLRLTSLQVTQHKASEAGKANTLLPPSLLWLIVKAQPMLMCA